METPISIWARGCRAGAEIDGVTVPPGSRMCVLLGSANRDERHYPDPDRYDVRRDPHDHIIYANQAAVRSMGFETLEELQRRPPQAIFDDYVVLDERGRPLTMDDILTVRLLGGETAEPLRLTRDLPHRAIVPRRVNMRRSAVVGEEIDRARFGAPLGRRGIAVQGAA